MHRFAHTLGCRVAAALLALALSGVARAAPRPVGPHRCECRAHGAEHVCACPVCSAAARRARASAAAASASDANLPPCHRAAAARARDAEAEAERRRGAAPCLVASCGLPEGGLAAPESTESFTLPRPPALARADVGAVLLLAALAAPARSERPELPPPRA